MPTKPRLQYTIRGVPADVDQALRHKARQRRISLNQLLIEELTNALGASTARKLRSLDHLAGRWTEDPEFDRVLTEQRQIDESDWR